MTENEKLALILKEHFPYTAMYIKKYGIKSAVSNFQVPAKYGNKPENLYKECIEKGKRWEEIIKKAPDDVLL